VRCTLAEKPPAIRQNLMCKHVPNAMPNAVPDETDLHEIGAAQRPFLKRLSSSPLEQTFQPTHRHKHWDYWSKWRFLKRSHACFRDVRAVTERLDRACQSVNHQKNSEFST
jgi:hypothetical protein